LRERLENKISFPYPLLRLFAFNILTLYLPMNILLNNLGLEKIDQVLRTTTAIN
jgi:hypothetical protein